MHTARFTGVLETAQILDLKLKGLVWVRGFALVQQPLATEVAWPHSQVTK